jgi:hypothetical protein
MEHLAAFKIRYLKQLAAVGSFRDSYVVWGPHIRGILGGRVDGQSLFNLGDHLSEIFRTTGGDGRSQGSLSGGGAAWECLVCWYLNLIFWNTPIFVARQNKSFVPPVINDSICVTISNTQTNTESDIVIFSVPEVDQLEGNSLKDLNEHLTQRIGDAELCVLQCKTNWNDNAQIPMLWDMIYNSSTFRIPYVSVGRNGVNPSSFRQFSYAFVTVPSNQGEYKPMNTAVLRVKGLTGGNYWGRKTEQNIAASLKELPGRRFPTVFSGGVISHMDRSILHGFLDPEQFIDCSWG